MGIEWLPKLNAMGLKDDEKIMVVMLAYLGTCFMLVLLVLALHNTIQYLIRQSRWKVLPLLFFYLMAVMDLTIRLYTMVFVA